jgi:hypothetical protein
VEFRDFILPPLIELLKSSSLSVQSATMSALTELAEHGESWPYKMR